MHPPFAPPKSNVPFVLSWKLIALYVTLVIWTPVFHVPGLPPVRFDDVLILIAIPWMLALRGFRVNPKVKPLILLLFSLYVISIISMAVNANVQAYVLSFRDFFNPSIYLRYILIFVMVAGVSWNKEDIFRMLLVILAATLPTLAITYGQMFNIGPIQSLTFKLWSRGDKYLEMFQVGYNLRAIGTIGNPNNLAFLYGIAATQCLLFILYKRYAVLKPASLVAILVFTVTIPYATGSRMGILCLLASLGCFMLLNGLVSRRIPISSVLILFLGGIAITYIAIFHYEALPNRIKQFAGAGSVGTALEFAGSSRMAIWESRWAEMNQSPFGVILGVGYSSQKYMVVDNGFLHPLYASGICAFLLNLALWGWALCSSLKLSLRKSDPQIQLLSFYFASVLIAAALYEMTSEALVGARIGPLMIFTMAMIIPLQELAARRHSPPPHMRPPLPFQHRNRQ